MLLLFVHTKDVIPYNNNRQNLSVETSKGWIWFRHDFV